MRRTLNIVELDPTIIRLTNTDLRVYETDRGFLIRLLHPDIVAHPYICYKELLYISSAPFTVRKEHGYTLFSIAQHTADKPYIDVDCPSCRASYLDKQSILLLDAFTRIPLKIIRFNVVGDLKEINTPFSELVNDVLPIGLASYLVTERSIELVSSEREGVIEEHRCIDVEVLHFNDLKICICRDTGLIIASDGIYGYSVKVPKSYITNLSNAYLTRSLIALQFDRNTVVVDIRSGVLDILPKGFLPIGRIDRECLGVFDRSSLAILNLDSMSIKPLYRVENIDIHRIEFLYGRAAFYEGNKLFVLDIDSSASWLRLDLVSTPRFIALTQNYLLIGQRNGVYLYAIDTASSIIRLQSIATLPPIYTVCRSLHRDLVVCIDTFNRITILNLKNIELRGSYTTNLSSTKGIAILMRYHVPFAPPSIRGSITDIEYRIHRLSTFESIVYISKIPRNAKTNIVFEAIGLFGPITANLSRIPLYFSIDRLRVEKPAELHHLGGSIDIVLPPHLGRALHDKLMLISSDGIHVIELSSFAREIKTSVKGKVDAIYIVRELDGISVGHYLPFEIKISIPLNELTKLVQLDIDSRFLRIDRAMLERYGLQLESAQLICRDTILDIGNGTVSLNDCREPLRIVLNLRTLDRKSLTLSIPFGIFLRDYISVDNRYIGFDYKDLETALRIPSRCIDLKPTITTYNGRIVLRLELRNTCPNIYTSIIVNNTVELLEPKNVKSIEIDIPLNYVLASRPVYIALLEPTGPKILKLAIDLIDVLRLAYATALKLSLSLGVRA